jgi:molybdopterin-binding protein
MLSVRNLSLQIGTFALRDVNFTVEKAEYFVILGPSGVGKSLLLEAIAGLLAPESGAITLRDRDITREKIQKRNLSIVYQDGDLFPHLTVFENIAYPLKSRGARRFRDAVVRAAAHAGIGDKLDRKPDTLSGGEYQRAALARCLAAGSDIFLLDEPLSALDARSKNELRALLRKLNREGITMVHVTHDYEEAVSLASKIGILENGRLVHVATPEEIFRTPKSEFIAHFVGIKNYLRGDVKEIPGSDLKEFLANGIRILALTDTPPGEAHLMIRPDDIVVSNSPVEESSRNQFPATISDIVPARLGLEVRVDVGLELVATLSSDAAKALGLAVGGKVWVHFKASACRVYS